MVTLQLAWADGSQHLQHVDDVLVALTSSFRV